MKKHASSHAVGIDLGTSFSSISYVDEIAGPRAIGNAEGDTSTPSLLYKEGDRLSIGMDAVEAGRLDPGGVTTLRFRDDESLNDQAAVLGKLRTDSESIVGPAERAVIAVPSSMSQQDRQRTREAARMTGISEVVLVDQTDAAAICFAADRGWLVPERFREDLPGPVRDQLPLKPQRLMIYSMGHASFASALVEVDGGVIRTLASSSDWGLSGKACDDAIVDYIADEFVGAHGFDPRHDRLARFDLMEVARRGKHALSARKSVSVSLVHEERRHSVTLTRLLLAELVRASAKKTIAMTRSVLDSAKTSWSEVDHLVLAGGATRMVPIRKRLKKESGIEPDHTLGTSDAISRGASILAWSLWEGTNRDADFVECPTVTKWLQPCRIVKSHSVKSSKSSNARKIATPSQTQTSPEKPATAKGDSSAVRPPVKKLIRPKKLARHAQREQPNGSAEKQKDHKRQATKTGKMSPDSVVTNPNSANSGLQNPDFDEVKIDVGSNKPVAKINPGEINLGEIEKFSQPVTQVDTPVMIEPAEKQPDKRAAKRKPKRKDQ